VNPRGGAHRVEHDGRVTSNLGLKSLLDVKAASSSRRASRLRIFATTRNPNRRRIGHWSEYQGMALRLVQFLAVMLTALALVHLAALPNKMAMAHAAYFVTQQIYAGWALFGIVLFGALVANLAHTDRAAQAGPIIRLCARLIFAFCVWTFPTNKATNNCTVSTIAAVEPMVCGHSAERKEIRRRSARRTVTNAVLAMLGVPSRDLALPLWALVCDRYYIRRNDTCSTLSYWGCLRRRRCHRRAHQT